MRVELRECRERHLSHLLIWGTDQSAEALGLVRAVLAVCRAAGGSDACLGCWSEDAIGMLRERTPDMAEHEFARLMPVIQKRLLHMVREVWLRRSMLLKPTRTAPREQPPPEPPPPSALDRPDPFLLTRTSRRLRRKVRCYAVRVGSRTGVFEDFRGAQGYTRGFKGAEWKGFTSMKTARAYLAEERVTPDQVLQRALDCERQGRALVFYTDGSATRVPAAAGWGWLALDPATAGQPPLQREVLVERWGAVVFRPTDPVYLGAARATNNTGELSAIGQALIWAEACPQLQRLDEVHIRTDSQWAQRVLSGGRLDAIKSLVLRVRDLLAKVRTIKAVHLQWVRGHHQGTSETAHWNNRADRLALRGRKEAGVAPGEVEGSEQLETPLQHRVDRDCLIGQGVGSVFDRVGVG